VVERHFPPSSLVRRGKEDENVPYTLLRHKVEDYERWKPVFDEHRPTFKQSGSKGGRLLRNADDPNEIIILLEWDDLANARQFYGSDDLRETMQRAGGCGRAGHLLLGRG
jgi:heme-degrading monooxygenase HmoA